MMINIFYPKGKTTEECVSWDREKKLQTMLTQQAQRDKKRTILVNDEECYHKFKG